MKIKNSHIKEAQNIFIDGSSFDENRKDFIECLNTCDLIAVPGSGKTTALLAKLYCISKQLPFNDGSGILVLAHTNASVNEIKEKLKRYCPNILNYPNFIGTIQGFVNEFLAKNANFKKHGSYLHTVDDNVANTRILRSIKSLAWNSKLRQNFFFQVYGRYSNITKPKLEKEYSLSKEKAKEYHHILKKEKILGKSGFNYTKVNSINSESCPEICPDLIKLIKTIHNNAKKKTDQEKDNIFIQYRLNYITSKFDSIQKPLSFGSESGKELLKIIECNLQEGIARYKDCYSLGVWHLKEYPTIIKILQNRFKYVFIDEMQDLETFQIDIIDKIFHNDDSTTIMQRVGDINQAIYNPGKKIKIECDWKTRESINPEVYTDKYITGSPRLTEENANIVNCFTLDGKDGKFKVEGLRKLNDVIPPHLIVFKKETTGEKLKAKFIELIKRYKLTTIQTQNTKFKIIGWAGERENDDKDDNISLRKLFNFNKVSKAKKETFDTLSEHLQLFDKSDKTLKSVRNSILNIFVRVLQFEEKKIIKKIRGEDFERFYTKTDILNYFKYEVSENVYTAFKNRIYHWCISIIKYGKCESVYKSIVKCIQSHFANYFELGDLKAATKQFIGFKFIEVAHQIKKNQEDELEIEIATVHSVKGETHCATMYVETYFHKYETKKIKNKLICPLFGHPHQCEGVRAKEAVKMMYVGFSRPTHLLCFAALEENVIDDLEHYKKAGWEIETV